MRALTFNRSLPNLPALCVALALSALGAFPQQGAAATRVLSTFVDDNWQALGSPPGVTGGLGTVWALAIDTNGMVYAGGDFTSAGGKPARSIARWNGTSWSALGSGIEGQVYTLAIGPGNVLYAGGYFTNAGGVAANRVARWNGSAWSALGSGVNGNDPTRVCVQALIWDGAGGLLAGGRFDTAGGVVAANVARWNGSSWVPLGSALNGTPLALAVDTNGIVYAGGSYMYATNGTPLGRVASFRNGQWSPVGQPDDVPAYQCSSLLFDSSGSLYAGLDDVETGILRWDGSSWSTLGPAPVGTMQASINELALDPWTGHLLAGGDLRNAGTVPASGIAAWNGGTWMALGSGMDWRVMAIVCDGRGRFYAAGDFITAGGLTANGIAMAALPAATTPAGGTLGEAVELPALAWTTGGNANWYRQTAIVSDDEDATQSGDVADNQQSWMQSSVTGPGYLEFRWKVCSEADRDFLRFYLDGTQQAALSGSQAISWQTRGLTLGAGSHVLKWAYTKNGSKSVGFDAGWVDRIAWTAYSTDLANATDAAALNWTTGGSAPWFRQTAIQHDGVDAAQSGNLGSEQESWMETTVNGPGTFSFWYNILMENGRDRFVLLVDDATRIQWTGGTGTGWYKQTVSIAGSGPHRLRWLLCREAGGSTGPIHAVIDEVVWAP